MEFGSNSYFLNEEEYPRYRQYLLSLDVDFTKIPTRLHFKNGISSAEHIQGAGTCVGI